MTNKMKLEKASPEIAQERLKEFKKLFPEAISEGRIDIEALRRTVGESLAASDERYTLNWAGKAEAFKALQTPSLATLAPCPEESVDFNKTANVFIEGENLEVLKVLQKAYYGKIKMIYIDPPYNTGKDSFIYPDRFQESKEEYLKRIEEKDEEGYLLKEGLFRKNSKENGHYHSNWLSMMYPRLFLARNLLKEDGIIFVSIDDNEVHNLRLLMNEIFGEENFLANLIWRNSSRSGDYVAVEHEYILLYAKNISQIGDAWRLERPEIAELKEIVSGVKQKHGTIEEAEKVLTKKIAAYIEADKGTKKHTWLTNYSNVDEDWRIYYAVDLSGEGDGPARKFGDKLVPAPAGRHWMSQEYIDELSEEGRIVWRGSRAYRKLYIEETRETMKGVIDFPTRQGSEFLKNLLGKDVFTKPKPHKLVEYLMKFSVPANSKDIVLDFFAGSGTVAHALFEANAADKGNRQFICIQLPEKTEKDSEAYKAGYKNIAEIGKERIRRVRKTIKTDNPKTETDIGVKIYKLKNSNFKIWRGDVIDTAEDLEKQLDLLKDPVKPEVQERNLLWELCLKSGYDLNTQIEEQKIGKCKFYVVAGGALIVLLSKADETCLQEIRNRKPQKVVCLDSVFENNDQLKTNTALQMKDAGIELRTV